MTVGEATAVKSQSGERDRDTHLNGPGFFDEVIGGDELASYTPKAYSCT